MHPICLISFGYLHLPTGPDGSPVPPAADRIEDVRDRLRDPAAARDILDLDGLNPRVQDVVLNTPGARDLFANLADYAALPAGPRRIAVGCAGGGGGASTGQPDSPSSLLANCAPAAARSTSNTSTSISRASSRRPTPAPERAHDDHRPVRPGDQRGR
ncbi:hypothetical protein [Streptomyces sp.]|uniref:RapZ C-terminal domain-containing protein n=1 Tax=Streptomyces sp. TaxID=1931 RepID=UPI002810DCCB|nr:hypothetical protein [Streptomyces sp.]